MDDADSSQAANVRILHLEDSAIDAELVCEMLHADGLDCDIDRVWTREDFERQLVSGAHDLILADHRLPTFDGESALEIARVRKAETPFIFVSGTLGEEVAVEALKRGATDYVTKQRLDRLSRAVRRALEEAAIRQERQRAESALRTAEANFATLVNAMPQICWMADPDGQVVWFNDRWYAYTGSKPEEMAEYGWRKLHHPDILPVAMANWRAALISGQPFEMTFPLKGADSSYRPFLTRAEPVKDEHGTVLRWLGTSTDVSAQQAAEEALRSLNDTLEHRVVDALAERERAYAHLTEVQKLETIGQLTGGVAHDFNNLLTPIIGNLDMLKRRIPADPRTERLLTGALQAAERAQTLVQRLLAFARRQVLDLKSVDLPAMLANAAELIARSIGPSIELQVHCDPDLPAARVDENQLELGLLNLAVNARDAMPHGGVLTINADAQLVDAGHATHLRHGSYVRITVTDTGSGMDAPTLKRAVEPFFSTKGIGKGTGLGLSMVHGMAAQSGGVLLLTSSPGNGTRAEIWLPTTTEEPVRPAEASSSLPQIPPVSILLVDDEDATRASTAEMLIDLGHRVTHAPSGAAALQLVRNGLKPDALITDYLMPGLTGIDLIAELRELGLHVPSLILTGYAQLAGHQLAEAPLLTKPFKQAELAGRLATMFSRGS